MENRTGTEVFLPSRGFPYGSLITNGRMEVYSMTTLEEKMFAGITKKIDFENVIDQLIRRCSSLPQNMRPGELYVGDRSYLMMNIRACSYGAKYGFSITCSKCNARWDHTMDVTEDLEIREASDGHEDPFKITLPHNGDEVTLRLFRGDDERSVIRFIDQSNRKVNVRQIGDPGYTHRLALHVVGVEVAKDPSKSFSAEVCKNPGSLIAEATVYIEGLSAIDSSLIREEIDNRTPGLILAMEVQCPKCPSIEEVGMPITADFFRAKSTGGLRTTTRVVSRSAR